ncbi:hypothetical protein FB451DRAFT_1550824 [Mycena latifolia]|nr:hypothetical protein FB451DRAFT_1550824 [Mycena latifolia]
MHATPTTIPTVQHVAEASVAAANTHESTVAMPVNHNGPQCAHCGWRGGSHAYVELPLQVITKIPHLAAITSFLPQYHRFQLALTPIFHAFVYSPNLRAGAFLYCMYVDRRRLRKWIISTNGDII